MNTLLLLVLYGLVCAGVRAVARAFGRPIPPRALAVCALLAPLGFAEAFLTDRTILPADHRQSIPPWTVPGAAAARNPNLNDAITQFAPWEGAARAAVETAARTVRDLRVAEVVRQDVTIGDGGVVNFRVRLGISFKYDSGD